MTMRHFLTHTPIWKEAKGVGGCRRMASAENYDGKITYKLCALEEYNYPENAFGLVISNLVLHYIEDLEKTGKGIR